MEIKYTPEEECMYSALEKRFEDNPAVLQYMKQHKSIIVTGIVHGYTLGLQYQSKPKV